MSKPKALMTHYAEGSLISRELNDMMTDYAAEARFDLYMHDDIDLYADRQHAKGLSKFNNDVEPEAPRSLIKIGLIA